MKKFDSVQEKNGSKMDYLLGEFQHLPQSVVSYANRVTKLNYVSAMFQLGFIQVETFAETSIQFEFGLI